MTHRPKVYIYALSNVAYDGYYISGLKKFLGIKRVIFSTKRFPRFGFYDGLAVIIKYPDKEIKLCIDANDRNEIILSQLEWCDVYGKVNYNPNVVPRQGAEKVIPIGSSFGIRLWNLPETIFMAGFNFIRFYSVIPHKKLFLSNYWAQYLRKPLSFYLHNSSQSKSDYVFFVSTIWKNNPETNQLRANFIAACKEVKNIHFEGGFAPRKDGNQLGWEAFLTDGVVPFEIYLKKTIQSLFVFSTPAVDQCHGWKLAEYLALGKVIISTPFSNEMAIPLQNGQDIILLKEGSKEEIVNVIHALIQHPEQILHIENHSKRYFMENLLPEKVIRRLLEHYNLQNVNSF